jgi:hypothetical protein
MARQGRQFSYVAEFTSDIQHIQGKDNVVADTLSRLSQGPPAGMAADVKAPSGSLAAILAVPLSGTPCLPPGIDLSVVAAHQLACEATQSALATSSLLAGQCRQLGFLLVTQASHSCSRLARCVPHLPSEYQGYVEVDFFQGGLASYGNRHCYLVPRLSARLSY